MQPLWGVVVSMSDRNLGESEFEGRCRHIFCLSTASYPLLRLIMYALFICIFLCLGPFHPTSLPDTLHTTCSITKTSNASKPSASFQQCIKSTGALVSFCIHFHYNFASYERGCCVLTPLPFWSQNNCHHEVIWFATTLCPFLVPIKNINTDWAPT